MQSFRKYFTGVTLLAFLVVMAATFGSRLSAENKPSGDDDFLKPKNENSEPATPGSDFQKRFDSLMNQPFFNDPSLNNLRGFDLFDQNLNEHLQRMMKSLDAFPGMNKSLLSGMGANEDGNTDIREVDDKLLVRIDLPGHDKNSIDLKLRENRLVISSERRETSESKDDKSKVFRSEVSYGSFSRVIELPRPVIEDKIEAKYENGVLTVIAPIDKTRPQTDNGRKIQIN